MNMSVTESVKYKRLTLNASCVISIFVCSNVQIILLKQSKSELRVHI